MSIRYVVLPIAAFLATAADAPALTALSALEPGRWTLTSRDGDFTSRSICLGDPSVLLQIRQPVSACSRYVITNDKQVTTVHYTCPGSGHGRTTVRVETPRLAQVETQGVIGSEPFDISIEARRAGTCSALSMR